MGKETYLAIDVGGTKTLFAIFYPTGELVCECKISSPQDYEQFKASLAAELKNLAAQFDIKYGCCAIPGTIDFANGIGLSFGNLPWNNVPIGKDLQAILPDVKFLLHNDAKLAGLSESILLQKKYKKVLYLTISTGMTL
jgi:predicted NBD/HSP70 family sugar kinase